MGELPANEKLRIAAGRGDIDAIKELIVAGSKFDVDKYGRTALHYAAHFGHTPALKECIALGCALNVQDTFGCTALHKSVMEGHVNCTAALLDQGCDVESRDENGHTALHEACWSGYSRSVDVLIRVGKANIHATNKNGQKPIHLAVQNGHNETTRVLLKAGTNPDIRNNENGETPLHVAAMFGHVTCTRILLSGGGNGNAQNKVGNTPLHVAAGLNKKKVTRVLLEAGCSTHLRNRNDQLPLELARNNNHSDVILLILSAHKLKKAAKKSFFSRKKKQISDESHDSSSDLGSYREKQHNEKLDESTNASSSPRVKGRREMGDTSHKGDDSDDKKRSRRDSDSRDSRSHRSSREVRRRREREREKQHLDEDNKLAQGMFAKDELRRRIEREKRLQYDVQVGRITGDPGKRTQYVKDKNGKIIEIPMSPSSCACSPYIRKLENQIEATKEGLLHEIDLSRSKFESRMRNLDKRMSHQAQCLDQLSRERVAAEKTECLHRIDRRAGEERALLQEEQEARVELLREEMKQWVDERIQPLHERLSEVNIEDMYEDMNQGQRRSKSGVSAVTYQDSGISLSGMQSNMTANGTGTEKYNFNCTREDGCSQSRRQHGSILLEDRLQNRRQVEVDSSPSRRHVTQNEVNNNNGEDYISRGARPKETQSSGTTTQHNENGVIEQNSRTESVPLVSAAYRPPLVSTQERMFSVIGRARPSNGPSGELIEEPTHPHVRGYMMTNHVSDQSSGDDSSDSESEEEEEITETKSQVMSPTSSVKGSLVNGRARSEVGLSLRRLASNNQSASAAASSGIHVTSTPQAAASPSKKSSGMSTCSSSGISSAKSASLVSSSVHRNQPPPPPPRHFSVPAQVHQGGLDPPPDWRNRPRQVMDVPPRVERGQNDRSREWRSSDVSSQSSVSSFKRAMKNGELQL